MKDFMSKEKRRAEHKRGLKRLKIKRPQGRPQGSVYSAKFIFNLRADLYAAYQADAYARGMQLAEWMRSAALFYYQKTKKREVENGK